MNTLNSYRKEEEMAPMPFRVRVYGFIRRFLVGFVLVSIANLIFSSLFYTPKIYNIIRENEELIERYRILNGRIAVAGHKIEEIRHRDRYIYRSLFGVDTISFDSYLFDYPESKYLPLQGDTYSSLMTESWMSMDRFARSLYGQSTSLDELQELALDKTSLEAAIPAIWPIDRTLLRGAIGAFGMRRHPIKKRYIMHKGIDLAGKIGDPIYATGDGVVERTMQGLKRSGYGQEIMINHEYGYKTRYAHLSKRLVSRGDSVKRGDLIGLMGNTGGSTGPHLHYEVIYKGVPVNPINYFNRNMTSAEYRELMDRVQETKLDVSDE